MALENIKKDTHSSGMLLLLCHSSRKLGDLWCMLVTLINRCNHNVTWLVEFSGMVSELELESWTHHMENLDLTTNFH